MAIQITPTRTGADVGLREIAVILSEQNQVLAQTAESQVKLQQSFEGYLKLLAGDRLDALQKERRSEAESRRVGQSQTTSSAESVKGGGFELGNVLPWATGILGGMLKRGIPALLGVLLADEVGDLITSLTGSEILGSVAEWSTMGGAFGFLFGGVRGGILGAVLGAAFSTGTREKIAGYLSDAFNKEIGANDWETWATSAGGIAALYFGPSLLRGAMHYALSGNVTKDTKGNYRDKKTGRFLKPSLAQKFRAGFGGNVLLAAGVLAVGSAIAGAIGDEMGAEAGGLAQNVVNAAAFGSMFGPQGAFIAAVGMLAVEGGAAIIDYFRNKNKEMYNKAIAEAEPALKAYEDTGDTTAITQNREKVGAALVEARRMAEIGMGSGVDDAQKQLERTERALAAEAASRGVTTQTQGEYAVKDAIAGGKKGILDYAYFTALEKSGGNPTPADFQSALTELMTPMMSSSFTNTELRNYTTDMKARIADLQARHSQNMMPGAPPSTSANKISSLQGQGAGTAVVQDNSTNVSTNNTSSSPIVLPQGGTMDRQDRRLDMMLAANPLI